MDKKNIRFIVIGISLLFLFSCNLNNINNNLEDQFYIPIFKENSLQETKALNLYGTSRTEGYGVQFLPQLTYFKEVNNNSITDELSVKFFHDDIIGTHSYDENTKKHRFYYPIGENANIGYIEVILDQNNKFSYHQYLLLSPAPDIIMYFITEFEDCEILRESDMGYFTTVRQFYYGCIKNKYDTQGNFIGTCINADGMGMGAGKNYVHGSDKLEYSFVDWKLIKDEDKQFDFNESFISNSIQEDVTIHELLNNYDFIKNLNYSREDDMPMHDIYYDIQKDKYFRGLFRLTENDLEDYDPDYYYNCRTKEEFENYTGYTFAELGFSECDNLLEFLAKSTNVEYWLIGDNNSSNWRDNPLDGNYIISKFSVDKTENYLIFPGNVLFNDNYDLFVNSETGCISNLVKGETYYLGIKKENIIFDKMKEYSYILYLNE